VIYVDGSLTKKNGGARVVFVTPDGKELTSSPRLEFQTTNNEGEYTVVLAGLGLAQEMGAKFVEVRSDSQVIVGHIQGKFETKGNKIKLYLSKVQNMHKFFKKFCIVKILREENQKADFLARIGLATDDEAKETDQPIKVLQQSTIIEEITILTIEIMPSWVEEIAEYLEKCILPEDKKKATQLRAKAVRFTLVNGTLYKRGFKLPLFKCVSKEEGDYILREILEGVCGNHLGARVLVHKVVRVGFCWPNMNRDSMQMVKTYDKCQRFANITKLPHKELSSISSPWPFSQ
jgi:ribonuclease HI